MKKAIVIANAFLKLSQPDLGDTISNLKVQKLLYYAQGFSLAIYNKPLFKEQIISWTHGPVVVEVYNEFGRYGAGPIPVPNIAINLTKNEIKLISDVWKVYGQFSAWKLRDMTHSETPWKTTPRNRVISQEKLKKFFKTRITNE